jgi:hypothetical protein
MSRGIRTRKRSYLEKSFHSIAHREDTSLTQIRGGCIEAVPGALFAVVQEYLTEGDYRGLMNTNLLMFQHIKFHTAKYTFITPSELMKHFLDKENMISYLTEFVSENVQDKSKQVSVKFFEKSCAPFKPLLETVFAGCSFIHFYGCSVKKNTSTKCFNNVYYIHFYGCDITTVPDGLEGIVRMDFSCCYYLTDLSPLEKMQSLKKVLISRCERLNNYPNLPKLESFSFFSQYEDDIPASLFSYYSNLQRISITGVFPEENLTFAAFRHITHIPLIILQNLNDMADPPKMPVLHGRMMLILGFDLTDWVGKELPKTEWLKFRHCIGLPTLGNLPKVHTLTVYDCGSLQVIGETPCLRKWILRGTNTFPVSTMVIPTTLSMLALEDLSNLNELNEGMSSVPKLTLYFCKSLTSINGIDGLRHTSEVKLSQCGKVADLSPLKNVYKVYLEQLIQLLDGKDLCNVSHLTIIRCSNFKDTSHLSKIKKSLTIIECNQLSSLKKLQDVPRVTVLDSDSLKDLSGLGRNDEVTLSGFKPVADLYKAYQEKGTHAKIFKNIKSITIIPVPFQDFFSFKSGFNGELFEFPQIQNN